eukprot:195385_1
MDLDNAPVKESLPEVEVVDSLDEMAAVQKSRLFEYISNSFGDSSGETLIINVEMIRNWGTERIFIQKRPLGSIVGTALLVKSGADEDNLTVCGLCYNEQFRLAGKRLLESIVSTWEQGFSDMGLSVELSEQNVFIKRA